MTSPGDEFSYLPDQAAALSSHPATPAAERIHVDLPDDSVVSGIRYGTEAPQVTFLHGAGLNAHTWDTTVLALGLSALVLDLPGHGDSSWRGDADYRPEALGVAIATAISGLTTTPQVLIGHSLGGITAAWVAANHPELVQKLILVDITPGIDPSAGPAALRQFYAVTSFPNRDAVVDHALSFGLGGSRADTERGVFHNTRVLPDGTVQWKHHFAELAHSALGDASARLFGDDAWQTLQAVEAPMTLVRASDGFVNEDALAQFRSLLPRARVVTLQGNHNLQESAPEQLARIIAEEAA